LDYECLEPCGINDVADQVSGKYFDDAIRVIAERSKTVAANMIPYAELEQMANPPQM
jgi:hypothetical protein